ncbi:8774_t:CDS:2 [Entrophospora sp. SA101]|nr:8774_t:CDS:2 [Entrophospora sp. SA101]
MPLVKDIDQQLYQGLFLTLVNSSRCLVFNPIKFFCDKDTFFGNK